MAKPRVRAQKPKARNGKVRKSTTHIRIEDGPARAVKPYRRNRGTDMYGDLDN